MPVLRKNMIASDWVIFSPGRAKRPSGFYAGTKDKFEALKERPAYRESCPFCGGNESPEDKVIFAQDGDDGRDFH